MKRSQIVLFVVFIVITGIIYLFLSKNKKEYSKTINEEKTTVFVPVREVKNKLSRLTLVSYGQVLPNSEIIIAFEVQGKLEKGKITMKPGTNFKEGQILFRVNYDEVLYSHNSRKSALANLVLNAMPDIELDFPSEKNKWLNFMDDLDPSKVGLPELPEMATKKERMFITSRNIITEYYNLKSAESRLVKYVYIAPFNGTVISLMAEPGSIVNPGSQIAKIAKTGDFEVKVPISIEDLDLYSQKSSAEFTDASGKTIAKGKIIRISDVINQQTQSADVYYSISPVAKAKIYNGMFVNVAINMEAPRETMTLPRVAVKNGKVKVLETPNINSYGVTIVSSKPDSVFVTGLKNGQMVLMEQLDEVEKNANYKGVVR